LTGLPLGVSYQWVLIGQPVLVSGGVVVRALADPLRARIVELLAGESLCTCHLVVATGARQTNISNHLRVLRAAGLVVSEPAGRYTYHRLVPDRLEELAGHYAVLARRARQAGVVRRPCG
jgi:ArsR family transcriptional regulator, arsenate/arsenite/antimonite-responsive transcriptional repressor